MKITETDARRLDHAAKLMEGEADTWRDGFACFDGHEWTWTPKQDEWAQVRYLKLRSSAAYLRALAKRARRP